MANSKGAMGRLEKLETNVGVLTKGVEELNTTVATLATDAGELKGDVRELKGDVRDLKGDVRDLKGDVRELKTAAWRTTEILVDHSEQLTGLRRTIDERLGGVNDRLDRLIAVTLQERTTSTERLGDIERRLARLEERVGV